MSLRSIVLDHFWLKLFSLILATLIWLAVWANLHNDTLFPRRGVASEVPRTFLNRPIMVLTDVADRPAVSVTPTQASVTVRGPATLMQALKDEDIEVFVRLGDRRRFTGDLPLHVHVPAGANVEAVTPAIAAVRPGASP